MVIHPRASPGPLFPMWRIGEFNHVKLKDLMNMTHMKKPVFLILLSVVALLSFTSDKPAYTLFNQEGKPVKYAKMIKDLQGADIIFFGELHTDPIAHWLQLEITKELYDSKQDALILGAEMFEADGQLIMNEYLGGKYGADKFEAEMRLWKNYKTDYKPLVEFAKEKHIPFIATNIPRRYASMVYKGGFEALDNLSEEAKRYIAPLPINYDPEVRCYKEMLNMEGMGKKMPAATKKAMPDTAEKAMPPATEKVMPPAGKPLHGTAMPMSMMENLPKAQAAKDATMAYFILKNWEKGKVMFHLNGSYHSNNFEGIIWHLLQQNKDLKIMTIGLVQQEEIEEVAEENLNIANYIICVPESMTRTSR